MKREETYCDMCGTKMSGMDADGDTNIIGITMQNTTCFDICSKNSSGTTSSYVYQGGQHFCSNKCLQEMMLNVLAEVTAKCKGSGL